tara:strand:- start:181 stop:1389 length:1209 start_codon:yes stop_codon:yes gene_type:complete
MIKLSLQIFILFFFSSSIIAEEKFEALVATVNSDVVTTYDLSQRIKLALKSLQLEDNIKNRDSVRERVLELLILEKIKKNEAKKREINHTEEELIQFASILYNFPKENYGEFKTYIEDEKIDVDILMEQLSSELLWKKLLREKFSSIILISEREIDKVIDDDKKKEGKIEYNFTEILFENNSQNDWSRTREKIDKFLALLDQGISFKTLAEKFSNVNAQELDENFNWILEDNLDLETKQILSKLKLGEISRKMKIGNGYKIIKLNKKRKFGNNKIKYSFIKVSSFFKESINSVLKSKIKCNEDIPELPEDVSAIKIEEILSNELSNIFSENIEKIEIDNFSEIIEHNNEYSFLKLCRIDEEKTKSPTRDQIENKLYSQRFNQLANTFIANLRKNANIKFFNK